MNLADFNLIIPKEKVSAHGFRFRYLSLALIMLVARALFLLLPILYAVVFTGKELTQLLNDSLFYHLYYLLAFFDLICFVELYYVKKQLQIDPVIPVAWGVLISLAAAQTATLNAMSAGMILLFLYRNRNLIKLKDKLLSLNKRQKRFVLLNALFLAASLALFYYMLSLYMSAIV